MGKTPTTVQDLKDPRFYSAILGEFVGTGLLVLVGCGSTVALSSQFTSTNPEAAVVKISVAFGLSVAVLVSFLAQLSGGHINPAVTLAFLLARRVSIIRAIIYVPTQVAGAIAGAGLLKAMTPAVYVGGLGKTVPTGWVPVTVGQAFLVEAFITFMFILVIFGVVDPFRTDNKGCGPLLIGLTLGACHLFAIPYTGAAMNPARAMGPGCILGRGSHWDYHWIYWVGPIVGALVAALLYELVFAANASAKKFVAWISKYDYDNENWQPGGVKQAAP